MESTEGIRAVVYRNLHKGCWSVKSTATGRVVAHRDEVWVEGATFKVSSAGRARVLRERCKNVHAGVVGTVFFRGNRNIAGSGVRVRYNPYDTETFVREGDGTPVHHAELVYLSGNGQVFASSIRTTIEQE
jgi:hypothetical protein